MKHWKHHSKRGLALFLVLMMCMSLFPTTAFAVDGEHVHNDSCVKVERICGLEEHEHEDACYVSEEPQCSDPDAHQHTDECYDEDGALICDEPDAHQHEDACYVAQEPQCGKEAHQHDDDCYRWDCSGSEETEEIEEIEEVPEEVTAFVEAMKDIPEASAIDESNAAEIQEALFDEVLSDGWAMVDNNMEAAWITEEILAAYDKYTAVFTATEDVLENGNNPYYNWIQGKILNLGTVTKHVGESGFYQRLPRLTFTCRSCGGVVHEVIPGTDYDAKSWTDEEFLDNIRLLPNGPYKGGAASGDDFYIGAPCFEFDYRGIKPTNSTKVDIDLYYCYNAYSVSGSCDFCGNWVTTSSNYNIYKDDITFYVRIEGDYALMFKDGAKAAPNVNGMPGEVRVRNTTDTSRTLTVPSSTPTRNGYDFLGWFDKNDVKHEAGEQITLNWDTADKDMTTGTAYMELTAKWQCSHPKDADGNCTDPDCDHEEDCCKPATEYTVIREYYIDGKLEATQNTSTKAKAKDVIVGADLAAKNPSWKTENIGGVSHTFDYVSCNPTPSITLVKDATKNVITLRYEKAATYTVTYKDGLDSKLFGDVTYGRTEDESKLLGVGDPTTPCKNLAQYIQWGADRELTFTGWKLTSVTPNKDGVQPTVTATDANAAGEIIYTAQWLKHPDTTNTAENLVKVQCETNSSHQDATYGLLANGYSAAAPVKGADGVWTSVVTITTDTYVTEYNKTTSGHSFKSVEPASKQITLKWDPTADNGNGQKGQWVAQNTGSQVLLKVKCTPTTPKLTVVKEALYINDPQGNFRYDGKARPGDKITYEIKVTNNTNAVVTGVTVTDELDGNLTFVSAIATGKSWSQEPTDGRYELGNLAAAGTQTDSHKTLTITVEVNDNIPTTVTSIRNTAEASYKGQTPTDPKCTGSTDVTVDAFKPALTVDKDVLVNGESVKNQPLPRGTVVTYKVVVKNTGNCDLKDLVITDFMDKKVTLKQQDGNNSIGVEGTGITGAKYWAPTTTEGEILQFKGTLAKDGTITLTYQATVTAYDGTNVVNKAYATANADKTVSGGSGTTSTTGGINPSSIQVGFAGLPALMLTNNPMRFVGLGLTPAGDTDSRPNEDTITNGSQVSDKGTATVKPVTEYTVTFNSNGGSDVAPQSVPSGQAATEPTDPTKNNYVFDKWTTDAAGKNPYDFSTPVTEPITLYAQWTDEKVTVTFNANGGKFADNTEANKAVEVAKGNAVDTNMPANPTKDGFHFKGWKDTSGNTFTKDTVVNADVTVTAQWEAHNFQKKTDTEDHTVWADGKAPDCIHDGTAVYECSSCSATEEWVESNSALGHDFTNAAATDNCTSHSDATCTSHTLTCTRCNGSLAGGTKTEAHRYGEWIIDKAATTEEAGEQYRVCTVKNCGHKDTQVIPKLGTIDYPEYKDENEDGKPDEPPTDQTKVVTPGTIIIVDPKDGTWLRPDNTWAEEGKTFKHIVTEGENITLEDPIAKTGEVFVGWEKTETTDSAGVKTITYTARYEKDEVAKNPDGTKNPDKASDGIPDIWQPVVTYKVSGGTWDGTDATDKAYVFNLWEKDATGAWEAKQPTLDSTVPTGTPNAGYKNDGGKWSTTDGTLPGTTPVTQDAAYTLTFTQATVKVTNTDGTDAGTWTDGSTGDKTLTLDKDGKVTLPEITPPIGKELDKWVDQDGNEFDPSKPVDKDLELKPVWKNIGLSIDRTELTVVYDGNGHTVTPVVMKDNVPVAAGDATVTIGGYTDAANNPISGNPVNAGTYTAAITATVDGKTVTGTATVTILQRTLTVRTGSSSKRYDGYALTNSSITITGQASGESITGRTTGSQTRVGNSPNSYTLTWGAGVLSSNYRVVANLGTLEVTSGSTGGGSTGGGGGGGGRPGTNPTNPGAGNTTTIGDTEVPLAGDLQLNKTDHFAYIKGYQDGTVRPNNPITRAQVATIFYRLLDETSRVIYFQETNDFTDVASDYWANKAISTLTNAGIITGFSDGTFRPNAYITRAQFAAIAARFDNVVPGLNNPFTDVAEDYWARDLIAFAADRGWITGESGKFRPLENITRVEVMDFINNVLERHVDEQGLLENATKWSDVPVTDPNYYVVEEATNSHDYTRRTEGQLMENWTQLNPDPVWDE